MRKPWLLCVPFTRLQYGHSNCRFQISCSPSSLSATMWSTSNRDYAAGGSRSRLPTSSAALPARVPPVRSTFADNDRRLLQCLPNLNGLRLIPSGLGRIQPERCPPQPRQWIGVGSGDTGPGLLLGLPVGGDPVLPSRRRHGCCGSQQLPQQRYFLVRRRTVLAGPTTRQCPFAVPYGRPGQLRPGPGVHFPQFRNAGSGHSVTPRSVCLPNRIIFSPIHQTFVNTIPPEPAHSYPPST